MNNEHGQDCAINEFTGGFNINQRCTCDARERKEIARLHGEIGKGNDEIKRIGDIAVDFLELIKVATKWKCTCEIYTLEPVHEICYSCRCRLAIKKHNLRG